PAAEQLLGLIVRQVAGRDQVVGEVPGGGAGGRGNAGERRGEPRAVDQPTAEDELKEGVGRRVRPVAAVGPVRVAGRLRGRGRDRVGRAGHRELPAGPGGG